MVKWLPSDVVVVRGYTNQPVRLTAEAWQNMTRNAVQVFENAVGKPATEEALRTLYWLKACGVDSQEAFFGLKERLAQPSDPSRIVRCRRCNAMLTDPVSKVLGMGPDCRMGGQARRLRLAMAGSAR
jgi:hypothetical protein